MTRRQRCIPMFTSLEGSYSPFGESGWNHEGTPTPRRLTLFPLRYHHEGDSQPLSVDLKGGHQTLTNSTGVITRFDSSPKNSYPPRSLQTPRVTRSMGNAQNLLKLRFALVERWGRTGSITGWKIRWELSRISPGSEIWCKREWEGALGVLECIKWSGQP